MAVYLVFAISFRSTPPSIKSLLFLVAGLFAFSAIVNIGLLSLSTSENASLSIGVEIMAFALSGMSEAVIFLVFLYLFSSFKPSKSVPAIAAMFALSHTGQLIVPGLPFIFHSLVSITTKSIGVLLLIISMIKMNQEPFFLSPKSHHNDDKSEDPKKKELLPKSTRPDFYIITVSAFVYPFVFGFFTRILREESGSLYDPVMSSLTVFLLLIVFLFFLFKSGSFKSSSMVLIITPFFLLGCLLVPLYWDEGGHYVGGVLIKLGYSVFQVFLWGTMVRMANEKPERSFLIFGIILALAINTHGGLFGSMFIQTIAYGEMLMVYSALFASVLLAIAGMLFFMLEQRSAVGKRVDSSMRSFQSKTLSKKSHATVAERNHFDFANRFHHFMLDEKFTEREREILVELVHGYSLEEIGHKLGYSRETIKLSTQKIYTKTSAANKQELIKLIDRFEV